MAPRRLPPSRRTGRAAGFVEQRPALLIVCEGKTEECFLKGLRARWRIPGAKVQLVPQVGVPSTVVREARRLRDRERPDETWVVFDRDDHPCWHTAIDEAQRTRLCLAISNPCFEQWAILLHADQNADLHRSEVQRRLAALHRGYHHDKSPYLDVDLTLTLLDAAAHRSVILNRVAQSLGEPFRAPMTTFSDLVARLRSLA